MLVEMNSDKSANQALPPPCDVFQIGYDVMAGSPDSWLRTIGNIPAMVPAAAITYGGLIGGSPVMIDAL